MKKIQIKTILCTMSLVTAVAAVACSSEDPQDDGGSTGGGAGDNGDGDNGDGDGDGSGGRDNNGDGDGDGSGGMGGGGSSATGGASGDGDGDGDVDPVDEASTIQPVRSLLLDNAQAAYGATFSADGFLYVSGVTDVGTAQEAQLTSNLRLAVWRFNSSFVLDDTFGTAGKVVSEIVNPGTSYDIVEVAAGKFVVQYSSNSGVSLVHLDVVGTSGTFGPAVSLNNSFGWSATDRANVANLADVAKAACDLATTNCAEPAEDDCAERTLACTEATTSAQAAWPALTAPLFAERPGAYTSWSAVADKSVSGQTKLVIFAAGPAKKGENRVDGDRFVLRVLTDENFTIDPNFNSGAAVGIDVYGKGLSDGARRGIVEADGSMVSAGYTDHGGALQNHVHLIRLLPNGSLDPNFGFSDDEVNYPTQNGVTFFNPFKGRGDGAMAEAYGVSRQSSGAYVTTGYGKSYFDVATIENDLVTFRVLPRELDLDWGGNSTDEAATFGSFAIQSETDPTAGSGTRPYRENGRDIVTLADDRTLQVGCYDDIAAIFVIGKDGQLDETAGNSNGRIQYAHAFPFFKVALSSDNSKVAATSQARPKAVGSYAKTLIAGLVIEDADD